VERGEEVTITRRGLPVASLDRDQRTAATAEGVALLP
jgi:antitoxin (DNA-binding transcriptional repressor) of toxin-antitoxin stability system